MQSGRKLVRWAYFWPGLPQLWKRGSWVGLAVAVGFTTLANTLILAALVYHAWIPREQQLSGWALLVVMWLGAWWQNRRELHREAVAEAIAGSSPNNEHLSPAVAEQIDNREQWYREAQRRYLQGDWIATEQLLLKLLKQDASDIEARLLLATLWRRQGRHGEASRQLDKLARCEAADKWQREIAAERQEIAAALADSVDNTLRFQHTDPQDTDLQERITDNDHDDQSSQRLAA